MGSVKWRAVVLSTAMLVLVPSTGALAAKMPMDITDGGKKLTGDPDHGKSIFNRCMVCHTIQAGVNHMGPSLHGVVGRNAGTAPGFSYSVANKKSGIVWTEQEIFVYLQNPQKTVPGTKMTFPGLPNAQDRADVIAYLKQNS